MTALLDDADQYWRGLRALRSRPPGWAAKGERRLTFDAALAQSEDLWRAAKGMPPESSPIVLFYSLAQGCQALAAAGARHANWRGSPSHGLTFTAPAVPGRRPPLLADFEVRPAGRGFVHLIAELMCSATLTSPVDIETLACSLPQHERFALETSAARRPLMVRVDSRDLGLDATSAVTLVVGPLPPALVRTVDGAGFVQYDPPSTHEVREWLRDYPRLADLGEPSAAPDVMGWDGPKVRATWPLVAQLRSWECYDWVDGLVDVAVRPDSPNVRSGAGLVLPSVGDNRSPQAPLVGWWVLMFAFSMLARYHPRTWTALLDVRTSTQAVPAEVIIGTAVEHIPRMIYEAVMTPPGAAPRSYLV